MTGVVVRALTPDELQAAAGVTARALADSPTTVAMYGADLLDGLIGLYAELGEWFALLPAHRWRRSPAGQCSPRSVRPTRQR